VVWIAELDSVCMSATRERAVYPKFFPRQVILPSGNALSAIGLCFSALLMYKFQIGFTPRRRDSPSKRFTIKNIVNYPGWRGWRVERTNSRKTETLGP